jgi:hypothetical protein
VSGEDFGYHITNNKNCIAITPEFVVYNLDSSKLYITIHVVHSLTLLHDTLYIFSLHSPPALLCTTGCVAAGNGYLVTAYSLSPLWRFVGENVPMQPRSRLSRPIFHVTKSGLENKHNLVIFLTLFIYLFISCDKLKKKKVSHTYTQLHSFLVLTVTCL